MLIWHLENGWKQAELPGKTSHPKRHSVRRFWRGGSTSTDKKYSTIRASTLTPCLDLFGMWCSIRPTGELGYNLLEQLWFISLSNEVEWSHLLRHSRKSAAPRPIQIKDLQRMRGMHEISSSDTALMAPPPEELFLKRSWNWGWGWPTYSFSWAFQVTESFYHFSMKRFFDVVGWFRTMFLNERHLASAGFSTTVELNSDLITAPFTGLHLTGHLTKERCFWCRVRKKGVNPFQILNPLPRVFSRQFTTLYFSIGFGIYFGIGLFWVIWFM